MKAEAPMARMREAHRELSASCRKQKTIRKTLQMVLHEICSIGGERNELFRCRRNGQRRTRETVSGGNHAGVSV